MPFPIENAFRCLLVCTLPISFSCAASGRFKREDAAGLPAPTIWAINNIAQIGAHSLQVLGSPRVVNGAMEFNGESDGLFVPVNPIAGCAQFTIEVQIKPQSHGPLEQRFLHVQDGANSRGLLELRMYENQWALDAFLFSGPSQKALFDQTKLHPADQWTWVSMTYRDGKLTSFVNGEKELEGEVSFPPMGPGQTSIGVRQNKISWFKGSIREARFHPVALPAEKLQK